MGRHYQIGWCQSNSQIEELHQFVQSIQALPQNEVEPLPETPEYLRLSYRAQAYRNPFQPPVVIDETQPEEEEVADSGIQPDMERPKELLEQYALNQLELVGTIADGRGRWAIIRSSTDRLIHRIAQGQYLGQNHGRIIAVDEDQAQFVEIIPDGGQGWVERYSSLRLKDE